MSKILLLCEKEHLAQLDRRSLRDCGVSKLEIKTSGIEAARTLAYSNEGETFDLVVCHERLSDMRYDQFIAIIRTHPTLKNLPVLIIPQNAQEAGIELNNQKLCDIITRPFSVDSLKKKLEALIAPSRHIKKVEENNQDTSAFEKALASYGLLLRQEHTTDEYFHMGMDFLKEHNWSLAISAFQKSVQDHKLKAEAELGMAAAYKGHNDLINFRLSLANAAQSFVQAGRWNRGRSAYARLLQLDKSAKNPFIAEAHRYIKIGDYSTAVKIIEESLPLIPKALAGAKLAQLCFLAPDPQEMFKALDEIQESNDIKILKSEIRQNLEILNKEKEERERQKNAERRWEINRRLAQAQKEEVKSAILDRPELRAEEKIPLLDEEVDTEEIFSDSISLENEDLTTEENTTVLAPLTQPEATSDLFVKKPKFNELLSVIKLTWKLARRSKKDN